MVTRALALMAKMRLARLPLTVVRSSPGPSMVRSLVMSSSGGQDDGAAAGLVGKADDVGAGVSVGIEDRLPQRVGAAVREVPDREVAGNNAVFQGF